MPKSDENSDEPEQTKPARRIANWLSYFRKLAQRSQWVLLFTAYRIQFGRDFAIFGNLYGPVQVWPPTGNIINGSTNRECHTAPCEHDDAHYGRRHHDLERLAARLVNSKQVLV